MYTSILLVNRFSPHFENFSLLLIALFFLILTDLSSDEPLLPFYP